MITNYSKLVCKLESIIGHNCYSHTRGKWFRYPIQYKQNGRIISKDGLAQVPEECIGSMFYQFGNNTLYIGKAITEILQFLNQEYEEPFFGVYCSDVGDDLGTEGLIVRLERLIGKQCYNKEFRMTIRYPIHYKRAGSNHSSKTMAISTDLDIYTMHYIFGDNHLYIGAALLEVLDYLSDNYGSMSQIYDGSFEDLADDWGH